MYCFMAGKHVYIHSESWVPGYHLVFRAGAVFSHIKFYTDNLSIPEQGEKLERVIERAISNIERQALKRKANAILGFQMVINPWRCIKGRAAAYVSVEGQAQRVHIMK